MASEVKTNKVSPSTGVTVTLGDASDVFQLPASAEIDIASGATLDVNGTIDVTGATVTGLTTGKVLQVLQSVKTDTATTTVSGTTFADITGTDQAGAGSIWCVKITPAATNSKILVSWEMSVGAANNMGVITKIQRDSVDILLGDTAGSRIRVSAQTTTAYNYGMAGNSMMYLDSPSTTSEVEYKVVWSQQHSSGDLYLNRTQMDPDNTGYHRATSTITVMEIGA